MKVVKIIALSIAALVVTTGLALVTCYVGCMNAMSCSTRAMTTGVRFHAHAGSCHMQVSYTDEDGTQRSSRVRGPDDGASNAAWQSAPLDIASGTAIEITAETQHCMAPVRCWITHHDGETEQELAPKVTDDHFVTCRATVP